MPTEERGGVSATPAIDIRPATAADADFARLRADIVPLLVRRS